MTLINQAQFLLTLPQSLFKCVINSAQAHDRDPMDEFVYRLYRSFDVVPGTPESDEEIDRLFEMLKAKLAARECDDNCADP